ncbi:condensation domain-containing protein, partial [uncultured Aquimarina sp.]|uniref:condensation domain-containing protein n=1 Tax=uncultured Aquimarina sp. TaxID=575652 RepID=UPI0026388E2C
SQDRLWFIEQYERGTYAYHIPIILELSSLTNKEGVKYALREIVCRHEVLRSTITQGPSQEGIQVVQDALLPIEEISLGSYDDLEDLLRDDVNRPFDLASEYPIRVKFYDIDSGFGDNSFTGRTVLLVNTHHIASDGWSIEIFERELFAYYEAYVNKDRDFSLPPLEIQYKDYALWQRSYLTDEILEDQLRYWRDKLSGYQMLALPTDYVRPSAIDYRGAQCGFSFDSQTSERLRVLAKDYGVTMHSLLLSATGILLGKYASQEDIVIGSPIANRHHRQTEGLIGFFVNTQVNRLKLYADHSYEELIQEVHQDQISAQSYQDLPFERLVNELDVERDTSRHPVFQVMFGVQSFGNVGKVSDDQRG